MALIDDIRGRREEIAALCRRYEIARLGIFGSALKSAPQAPPSDVDVLIDFTAAGRARAFDNYFGLRDALADLFGRPVDLVTRQSLRNPFFLDEVERTTEVVFVASEP